MTASLNSDEVKTGEVLNPDEGSVRLVEALGQLAAPFAKSQTDTARINADAGLAIERERTKQLGDRLTIAREVERRAAWFEFLVIAFVCVAYTSCLWVGLGRENMTLVGIGASGIAGFVGGLGLGRFRQKQN